jgi:hypothetical protein
MTIFSLRPARASSGPWNGRYVPVAIVVASALAMWVVLGLGILSLPGIALAAALMAWLVIAYPGWLMVLAGAVLFFPGKRTVFPHELLLVLMAFIVLVDGIRRRDSLLTRLDGVELANLLFIAYAISTVLWCTDYRFYMHGVRRLLGGALAFWTAYRLARTVPRRIFEVSLLTISCGLASSALISYLIKTSFLRHKVSRASATDLGWANSNTIASMLLFLGPPILDMAFRSPSRAIKVLAWISSAFNGFMQMIIASRAATILYFGGLYAHLTAGRSGMSRFWTLLLVSLLLTVAVVSPAGQMLMSRFSDLREMGGMIIRIWYWRVAINRTVEAFPHGVGLNQGVVQQDHLNSMGVHDYWLDVSSELGLPGVILWLVFLIVLFRRLRRMRHTQQWEHEGLALQVSFWLSMLHTLVEPTFQEVHFQYVFFWTMGGYLGHHALGARPAVSVAPLPVRASPREPLEPQAVSEA